MRFSLRLLCLFAVVSVACGPELAPGTEADGLAEVTGAVMTNQDAHGTMSDAFTRAKEAGVGTPAANRIITDALVRVGKKLPQSEVITVLENYVPYADFSVVEAGRTGGVWRRAAPKDTLQLVSFIGLLNLKMSQNATNDQNVLDYAKHAASVRAYLPSYQAMIKRDSTTTDMDVLAAVVRAVYPLTISSAEFLTALRTAGIETAPGGPGKSRGSGLNSCAFGALFGGSVNNRGEMAGRHDLASASSFEALVLTKLANAYVTYRDEWSTERDSTMTLGDVLNDIARSTGMEPAVALSVLKRALTSSEFAAMQALRATRR